MDMQELETASQLLKNPVYPLYPPKDLLINLSLANVAFL